MSDYVRCTNCGKSILEGIPFCPHCGVKQVRTKINEEFPKDPYYILQVSSHAEPEVIKAAYKRLALKYHPDVDPNPNAQRIMEELNWAYEILSNPSKRTSFDNQRQESQPSAKTGRDVRKEKEETDSYQDEAKKKAKEKRKRSEKPRNSTTNVGGKQKQKSPPSADEKPQQKHPLPQEPKKSGFVWLFVSLIFLVLIYLFFSQIIATNNEITPTQKVSLKATTSFMLDNEVIDSEKNTSGSESILNQDENMKPSPIVAHYDEVEDLWKYNEIEYLWEENNPFLSDLAEKDVVFGNDTNLYINLEEKYTNTLIPWSWYWCSKTSSILEENLRKIHLSFKINGEEVPYSSIYGYSYDDKIQLEDGELSDAICSMGYVVVSNWPEGHHLLTIEVNFSDEVDDGWEKYPSGTRFNEYYNVTVEGIATSGESQDVDVASQEASISKLIGNIFFSVNDKGPDFDINMVNADGTGLVNLVKGHAFDMVFDVKSEINSLIFCSRFDELFEEMENKDIFLLDTRDFEVRNLTKSSSDDCGYSRFDNNQKIVYESDLEGNYEIFSMKIDGSEKTRLTNNLKNDFIPLISPDENYISPAFYVN